MRKLKLNILFQILYQLLSIFIPLVTIPIVTRAFGAEVLGKYSYSAAIANYFALLCLLGLVSYGTREIAKAYTEESQLVLSRTFWEIYTLQIVQSGVVITLYAIYCIFLSGDKQVLSIIQSGVLIYTASDISWFYFGIEEFRVTVTKGVVVKVVSAILIYILIKTPSDVYLYAIILIGSQLASNLILIFTIKKHVVYCRPSLEGVRKHIRPNLILFIPVVAASFFVYIDKIMIGNISANIEVGYYEAMEKIINVPNAIITSIAMVLFPRISSNITKKMEQKSTYVYISESIKTISFFSMGCLFGIMAISDYIVELFFGAGYEPVGKLLILGGVIIIPRGLRQIIKSEVLLPQNQDKKVTIAIVCGAVSDFLLNLIMIPKYGALGATVATIVCEVISCILMVKFTKDHRVYRSFLSLLPATISGICMYVVLANVKKSLTINWFNLGLLVLIGGVLVFLQLYFFIFLRKKCFKKEAKGFE